MLVPIVAMAIKPQITERESIKPLALLAKQNRRPNEPVMFVGDLPRIVHGFTFYTDPKTTYDEENHGITESEAISEVIAMGSALCVASESEAASLARNDKVSVQFIGKQRGYLRLSGFQKSASNCRP